MNRERLEQHWILKKIEKLLPETAMPFQPLDERIKWHLQQMYDGRKWVDQYWQKRCKEYGIDQKAVEVTCQQLAEMYNGLPNIDKWVREYGERRPCVVQLLGPVSVDFTDSLVPMKDISTSEINFWSGPDLKWQHKTPLRLITEKE